MSRRWQGTRYLATTVVLAGVTGLLGMKRTTGPDRHELATLKIVAYDYGYEAPAEFPSGPTRIELVNRGHEPHHAQLLKLEQGKTLQDLAALPHDAPPPSWAVLVGGPNAAMPGTAVTVVQSLAPGEYAMVCLIPGADHVPHMMKGMVASFKVTPSLNAMARMPRPDATLRLVDYGFAPDAPLVAGARMIRVINDGPQPHELVMARLEPGKTMADYKAWEEGGFQGPAPARFVGGVVTLAQGREALFPVTLEAGNYLFICYVPDAKDGKPHFAHGMMSTITVSPAGV